MQAELFRKLLAVLGILTYLSSAAQKKDIADSLRQCVLAARYHSGFMFAHSEQVEDVKGTHPNGFELEYSRMHSDLKTHIKYNSFPRTGFAFTYVDYNRSFLGQSYSLSYFLEPNFRVGNSLKLFIRLSAGISYFNNPYDSAKNPENHSYSTSINSLLQLGFGLSYPISHHFAVYGMANFFHSSNAGFKEPNAGVNYINASLGLQYFKYSSRLPVYDHVKDTSWKHEPVHFDVSLFYSPKTGYNKDTAQVRKFVLGTSVTVVKRVSGIDALTAAAEIYYDEAMHSIKESFLQDGSSNVLAGLLVGHQFLLNRFIFSQEIGFYVYKQTKTYDETYHDLYHTVYHRWGITYNVKTRWYVGINLLAHKQVADFIDGRVVFRLR